MSGASSEDAARKAGELADKALSLSSRSHIPRSLAVLIAGQELGKGGGDKQALKQLKARLHQAVLAYEADAKALRKLTDRLDDAAGSGRNQVKLAALSGLSLHASTRERISYIGDFYPMLLKGLPVRSLLDLGCGLNPLSLPWMGLPEDASYLAFDASSACGLAVSSFFRAWGASGSFTQCDLSVEVPEEEAELALMMKLIPTLDRIRPGLGLEVLEKVRAPVVCVSFPTRSLGGRRKSMERNYSEGFEAELGKRGWAYSRMSIGHELAYIVRK